MIEHYTTAVQVGLALCALSALLSIAPVGRRAPPSPIGALATLSGLALLATTGVLGATAFAAVLGGTSLHGWALLAHVTAGGATCALLAMTALIWLRPCLYRARRVSLDGVSRLSASLVLLLGIATGASILVSTFPVLGTVGLERLLDVHRFAGLGFLVMLVFTASRVFRARRARHAAGQSQANKAPVTSP